MLRAMVSCGDDSRWQSSDKNLTSKSEVSLVSPAARTGKVPFKPLLENQCSDESSELACRTTSWHDLKHAMDGASRLMAVTRSECVHANTERSPSVVRISFCRRKKASSPSPGMRPKLMPKMPMRQ